MIHYHVDVWEEGGKRVGALTTTSGAAEKEKRIEEAGDPNRRVEVRLCNNGCFGRRLSAA